MKRSSFYLLLLISFVYGLHQAQAQYQLSQSLGAPYVESIYGAHDGGSLAWVVNKAGIRNIWFTDVETTSPRKITNYDADDGQGLSQIIISKGYLFYVIGSGNNRNGEISNPASLPQTPVRQILRINLQSSRVDTVDKSSGPKISTDGNSLVYTKGSSAYLIDDITAEKLKPRKLFDVRRGLGQLTWSHQGDKIAFGSNRGDHSFIGYYSIAKNSIHWMDPSLHSDGIPAWSPDGKSIAFIRYRGTNRDQLNNLMGGRSFEIVVADVETGAGNSIWQSPSDDGGFSQYYPSNPLRWTKENKILFNSEHEGWHHVYAINPNGSGIRDLTPGQCEVENNDLSEDNKFMYVTTNCGDINRRHIWRIRVSDGNSQMITDNDGIQTHPVALKGNAYAYREGKYNQPTSAIINNGSETTNLVELPKTYPTNQFVKPEAVTFTSADGLTIHGQLFLPAKGSGKEKLPVAIFMHGGPIRQMLLGYHYSGYYANAYTMNQYLTTLGYAVLSVNFRDGIGYGRDFRRAENQGPRGAAEYKDIQAAAKYLQTRQEIDPEKIGLWGGSYGGYLTAMGLAKNSDLFKAGVDLHGVHDWAWRARDFSPGGSWGITPELMDLAYHSSPISELQFWSSPVLIVHGDDDRNVMFGQSIDLKNKLDALGVHNEVLVFPDEVHGFLRYESWLKTYEATAHFFNRFLK
jgi:dipeptidyl aminopeptidase/acylaminoacyl peptidase